jgi:hypothetical protein
MLCYVTLAYPLPPMNPFCSRPDLSGRHPLIHPNIWNVGATRERLACSNRWAFKRHKLCTYCADIYLCKPNRCDDKEHTDERYEIR